jgi:hypothetical protein
MTKYSELLQEMRRQDQLLTQHITDMEAFELISKQNRQKVLMGQFLLLFVSLSLSDLA